MKGEIRCALIQLVIILVVVGVILWVINSYIPMQATIKDGPNQCRRCHSRALMAIEYLRSQQAQIQGIHIGK